MKLFAKNRLDAVSTDTLHIITLPDQSRYNAAFAELVTRFQLLDPDKLLCLPGAEVVKAAIRERKTLRLTLNVNGTPLSLYVKQYVPAPLRIRLGRLMKFQRERTARDEFTAMVRLHAAGIPTITPVAASLRTAGLFQKTSSLVTVALEGAVRLDDFLQKHLLSFAEKRQLIAKLALLVRSLHDKGFNHRDLYLCHVLRDRNGGLYLVDLHRVDWHRKVSERWRVKDIAALNYSAPVGIITLTDRIFFLKTYCQCNRLSDKQRRFARKVLKKTQKMIQHNRGRTAERESR